VGMVASIARWDMRVVKYPQPYIRSRIQGRMAGSDQRDSWDHIEW